MATNYGKYVAGAAVLLVFAGNGIAFSATNMGAEEDSPLDGPVPVNGGWRYFFWWGSTVYGNPFTFTLSTPGILRVTDAYCYGDRFAATDAGSAIGKTTKPGSNACGGPSNGNAAYDDLKMSSGCFVLAPGAHSIRLSPILNPFGAGGAFIRADDATSTYLAAGDVKCVLTQTDGLA